MTLADTGDAVATDVAVVRRVTTADARWAADLHAEAVLVTLAGPAGAGPSYRRLGRTLRDRHDDHDGRLLECYQRRL